MGVYSEINIEEINNILKHYELGRALDYKPTIEGISNSNYQVFLESGKEVLLKVSNDKTIEQLSNEQNILVALGDYNFEYSLSMTYRAISLRFADRKVCQGTHQNLGYQYSQRDLRSQVIREP